MVSHSIDSMKTRDILLVVVLLVMMGGYSGLYMYSASKVVIKQVYIGDLSDVSFQGATLNGDIEIFNGGFIPVSIEKISYKVSHADSSEPLVSGEILGGEIPAGKAVNYSISNGIKWAPTADLALKLITNEKTTAKIEGEVVLAKFWFMDVSLPFEKEIDLTNYLNQIIKEQVEGGIPSDLIKEASKLLGIVGAA